MLMLTHFFLELLHNILDKAATPLLTSLWEIKLDIGLFMFAIVIILYSDSVMAALGLGQAARATQAIRGAQVVTRFGIIEKSLRVILLTMDDFLKFALAIKRGVSNSKQSMELATEQVVQHEAPESTKEETCATPWKNIKTGDYITLFFAISCLTLIFLSPSLTHTPSVEVIQNIFQELSP
jgi:hypothetical protein